MRVSTTRIFMLLQLAAIMALMPAGTAIAADAISLPASEPYTIYYTTSGVAPVAPISSTPATSAALAAETISLVPNAGRGTSYVKPQKLKIHESKHEFEEHIKEKHGKRFKVERLNVKQTEDGLEGSIRIVENRDPAILQLDDRCTEEERARRIAIARAFILNNPEMIGVTENEELRERGIERKYCDHMYFGRFVNGYELSGSVFHFVFVPQYNYSVSVDIAPITPEMYSAAQQKTLTEEEIADIVYKDLNIPITGKDGNRVQNLPKLNMRKYLRNRAPYAYWRVAYGNIYEIDAITGEIVFKQPNVKY